MADRKAIVVLGLALAATISMSLGLGSAQTTSAGACTTAIFSLAPCLNYITGGSTSAAPSSSCCSQLSSVVQSQPQCLCVLLNGGASSFGLTLNQTRALALPGACEVSTPPLSRCNAVAGPEASPSAPPASSTNLAAPEAAPTSSAPSSTTPISPSTAFAPSVDSSSEAESKTASTTIGEISHGNSYKSSRSIIITAIFIATSISLMKL